jgi:hypothetical protein
MTNRTNADFLQVLLGQVREDPFVDLVLAESRSYSSRPRPRSQTTTSMRMPRNRLWAHHLVRKRQCPVRYVSCAIQGLATAIEVVWSRWFLRANCKIRGRILKLRESHVQSRRRAWTSRGKLFIQSVFISNQVILTSGPLRVDRVTQNFGL